MRSLLFLFLLIAGCTHAGETPSTHSLESAQVKDSAQSGIDKAVAIAGVEGENFSVEVITQENMSRLSEKYPVIYGGLPNRTLYQITTEKELIIVDLEEKKVLRRFRVVGIKLE